MKSMIDIYNLLKQFGIYIYTGDRLGDLELIEDEVKELYKTRLIESKDYQTALLLIRQEERRVKIGK
ncbi:MAG: YqgQ family protein [Lysinibacillus sp.]